MIEVARFGWGFGWFFTGFACAFWVYVARVRSPGIRLRDEINAANRRAVELHGRLILAVHVLRRTQAGKHVSAEDLAAADSAIAELDALALSESKTRL